jgi:hypothetical protein
LSVRLSVIKIYLLYSLEVNFMYFIPESIAVKLGIKFVIYTNNVLTCILKYQNIINFAAATAYSSKDSYP